MEVALEEEDLQIEHDELQIAATPEMSTQEELLIAPTDNVDEPPVNVEEVPVICPKQGCNLDLSMHSKHNREVHIKWCGHQKPKKPSKRKGDKTISSKEVKSFTSYFIKKKKVSENDNIDFVSDTPSTSSTFSSQSSSRSSNQTIFDDDQLIDQDIMNAAGEDISVSEGVSENEKGVLKPDVLVVDGDEDDEHVHMKLYCTGIVPAVMNDDIFRLFPFQLLPELETVVFSGNAIHHIECKKQNYLLPEGSEVATNTLCSELLNLKTIQAIFERSTLNSDELKNYNNKFLNHKQLSDKASNYRTELNQSKRDVIRLRNRVNKIGETVSLHQRFLLHVANNNIPRLNQLVAVALRNNRSISYILGKVEDAIRGVYRARPSEDDKDLALLVLEFGGPSLLDILFKGNHLPSVSTGYRMRKKSKKIKSTIGTSVGSLMGENTALDFESSTSSFSIKADETYVTPRPRYDPSEDVIQGLCSSHGVQHMKFDTYEEAEQLCEAVKNGTIHVPKEVTVVGGCSMENLEPMQIISAMPTCDKNDFDGGLDMFKNLSEEFTRLTGKDLCNFSTDGDATRRQIFNELLSHDLEPASPLGEMLCRIDLLDLQVGVHNETVSYDPKHLAKRCWTSFVNESVCIEGIIIRKSDVRILFMSLPEANSLKIDGLLHPKDKQNVPSATEFLLMFIEAMSVIQQKDFPYRLLPVHKQLTMLANVFNGLLHFYVYLDSSISDQLTSFSYAAHSLFYLTRSNPTKIIPNQLYHDLQTTFIDALFCCAKAKLYFPDKPLYLVKNGTDGLERVFGLLRMKVKNAALDYQMLLHCISSLLRCDEILSTKHPEWSRKSRVSRRLCLDYSNAAVWKGETLKLENVDVVSLWESGHLRARSDALEKGILKSDTSTDAIVLLGHTLKKPKGKLLGVTETEPDESQGEIVEEQLDEQVDADENVNSKTDDELNVPLADLIDNDNGLKSVIQVDGKNIYKASVVKMLFSGAKLSKDRLKRVQGLTAGTPGANNLNEDDMNVVLIGDPLLVFHSKETKVANIIKIKLGNVQKKSITIDDMEKPNLEFAVQFLQLVPADEGRMFWNGSYEGSQVKVAGRNCSLIKPAISIQPPAGMTNYFYERQFILDWGVQNTLSDQQQPSSSARKSASSTSAPTKKMNEMNKCKLCPRSIAQDRMRGHVAFHILKDKNVVGEVCGFCGLSSCVGKSKLIRSNKNKGQQYFKLDSSCPYFFSYGRRPEYSKRNKCSLKLSVPM